MALSNPFGPGSGKGRNVGGTVGSGVGAAVGSFVLPGLGTAAGSAIGGTLGSVVGGMFSSKDKPEFQYSYRPTASDFNSVGSEASQGYAMGGTLPVTTPEGRIQGPSHEQGGVQLPGGAEVEGGETIDQIDMESYVFSDRLTVPNSDMTFADVHQALKERGEEEKIRDLARLQEQMNGDSSGNKKALGGPADPDPPYARQTSPQFETPFGFGSVQEIMDGPGYTMDEATVTAEQPETAGPMAVSPRVEYATPGINNPRPTAQVETSQGTENVNVEGPNVSEAPENASTSPAPMTSNTQVAPVSGPVPAASPVPNPTMNNLSGNGVPGLPGNGDVETAGSGAPGASSTSSKSMDTGTTGASAKSSGSGGEGTSVGDAVGTAAQFLPAAMNVAKGLFGDSEVDKQPVPRVSNSNVSTLRRMETDVNVQPQINEIDQTLRGLVTNPQMTNSARLAAQAQSMRQKGKVMNQARRQEQKMENQKHQSIAQAQSKNSALRARLKNQIGARNRKMQMKADARKDQFLQQGVNQFSQVMARRQARQDQKEAQEKKMDMQRRVLAAQMAGMDDKTIQQIMGSFKGGS